MTVVIEHDAADVNNIIHIHGPFDDYQIAMDYGCKHFGGITGNWYWLSLVLRDDNQEIGQ